ncbi:molybdopterin-dependent oxidoreductase [Epidermidibacterium keratini]|uniref:Molybdopterin-dependent oxidoreductase n=1 Tax=Epidermidibacterium keratini TaxID=1891644 RepID=A0A7L4YN77_9ACTN|nr:molybdopterin-dependent oxidoreductase [Epidermidibacterium keratini]QHC00502.1 molybdopterin-dependent oxidoreductase [Epidermidibacterium keratini]
MSTQSSPTLHLSHWGTFEAHKKGDRIASVTPYAKDPDPHRIIENVLSMQDHPTRIDAPYVRKGWLEGGAGPSEQRGRDEFVKVSWDQALDLVAGELQRLYAGPGPESIYAGSYGWASAGRFHHAQSQLKRFLSVAGGYVASVNNYSFGASAPFLSRVIATEAQWETKATTWKSIAENAELVVAIGGLARKNSAIANGGAVHHDLVSWLQTARDNGVEFVGISPLRDDMPAQTDARWIPIRPASDGALLQAIARELIEKDLYDKEFIANYTVGFDLFAESVADKTPEWAAQICDVDPQTIRDLAEAMATKRTFLTMSWSMQRQQYGEHTMWLGVCVAAMLGHIGLPGGGFGHGYASTNRVGHSEMAFGLPTFSKGHNPVRTYIPVSRISDMLLNPGEQYSYDGKTLTYPDIKLVYWAGGNPFHHHTDLKRLREAFGRPDTIVVHDSAWTSTARHADIVLPATLSIERDDLGAAITEDVLIPMHKIVEPYGEARDDFAILRGLAQRLGCDEAFSDGLDTDAWLERIYTKFTDKYAARGHTLPSWQQFWSSGEPLPVPKADPDRVMHSEFRDDPQANPLRTPSKKIQLQSDEIEDFGYDDCPGTPMWRAPDDWDNRNDFPIALIANQPKTRLHSQLDPGDYSAESKVGGREPVRMHPGDAAERGISESDLVQISSPRGWCLAGVVLSEDLKPGVAQLSTGAWYDPDEDGNCIHGNPNVLVRDIPVSSFSRGNVGQHVQVQIAAYAGPPPPITVWSPPPGAGRR